MARSGLLSMGLMLAIALASGFAFSGPGAVAFWQDSVSYFSAADALKTGAFVDFEGFQLTLFPPVYPLVVATLSLAGVGRQVAAFAINVIAVAAMATVIWNIARRHGAPPLAALTLLVACFFIGPVPTRLQYAASELPFMALALVCLDQADRRQWARRPWRAFALGLLCSLAFLTRYSGLVVAAVAGFVVLVDRDQPAREARSAVAGFLAGVLPLSVAWVVRNHLTDGTWMGPRPRAASSVAEAVTGTATTLADWVVPHALWANTALEWLIVCGGALAAIVAAVAISRRTDVRTARTVLLFGAFAVIYVAFIGMSSLLTSIDYVNDRLLAPAYIPALLAVGLPLIQLLQSRHLPRSRQVVVWTSVLALAGMVALAQARRRRPPEIDYTTARWRDSPTTTAARLIGNDDLCYSNVPEPVYLWTGHRCARALMTLYRTSERPPDRLLSILDSPDGHRIFYVWYHEGHPDDRLIGDPPTLLTPHTVRRQSTADGEIYELHAAGGVASDAGESLSR